MALVIRVTVPDLDKDWFEQDPRRGVLVAEKASALALDAVVDGIGHDASARVHVEGTTYYDG
jgi:hypothetical protein